MKKNIMNQVKSLIRKIANQNISPAVSLVVIGILIYLPLWIWSVNLSRIQDILPILPVLGSDSQEYWTLSNNLANNYCFSMSQCDPETFRTPGYPVFLLITSFLGSNYFFSTFIQIVLSLGSGYLVYLIGKKFLSDRAAHYSMIFFVVEPSVLFHSLILLSDTLALFLLLLSVYFILDHGNKNYLLYSSLLLGASVLIRPITIFLGPVYLVFILIKQNKIAVSFVIRSVCIIILGIGVFVVPWMLRNYRESSKFSISSISAFNIFYYNAPMYLSHKTGEDLVSVQNKMVESVGIPLSELRKLEHSDEISTLGVNILKENLPQYLLFHTFKTTQFFFGSSIKNLFISWNSIFSNDTDYVFDQTVLVEYITNHNLKGFVSSSIQNLPILIERIVWLVILFFTVFSVFIPRNRQTKFLLFLIVAYFALVTGPVSYVRYRLPSEPFMFLLAANTIDFYILRLNELKYSFFKRYKGLPI